MNSYEESAHTGSYELRSDRPNSEQKKREFSPDAKPSERLERLKGYVKKEAQSEGAPKPANCSGSIQASSESCFQSVYPLLRCITNRFCVSPSNGLCLEDAYEAAVPALIFIGLALGLHYLFVSTSLFSPLTILFNPLAVASAARHPLVQIPEQALAFWVLPVLCWLSWEGVTMLAIVAVNLLSIPPLEKVPGHIVLYVILTMLFFAVILAPLAAIPRGLQGMSETYIALLMALHVLILDRMRRW